MRWGGRVSPALLWSDALKMELPRVKSVESVQFLLYYYVV